MQYFLGLATYWSRIVGLSDIEEILQPKNMIIREMVILEEPRLIQEAFMCV